MDNARRAPARQTPVRGLIRGLKLLQALSGLGVASVAELAGATNLPRPTVHRLLETLRAEGYVTRPGLRDAYRLALKVRSLAESYKEADWVAEVADPVLAGLSEEVVWPVDIATYEQGQMVIRATTHRRSPLSIVRVAAGRVLEMATTSTGRCYLAFCPPRERVAILETLSQSVASNRHALMQLKELERELEATRRRGYALRVLGPGNKTSSFSVPVVHQERVLACITLIWIGSAISAPTAVRRYLAPMRRAAAQIEADYLRRLSA